jgi:hypothetical protein
MPKFIRSSWFSFSVAAMAGGLALAMPQQREFLMWFFILGACYWAFEFIHERSAKDQLARTLLSNVCLPPKADVGDVRRGARRQVGRAFR